MKDITVEELKRRIENAEALNLIDVREEWGYEELNYFLDRRMLIDKKFGLIEQ